MSSVNEPSMIEQVIGTFDGARAEDADPTDLRVKPALVTLLVDQARLLDASVARSGPVKMSEPDLRTGFGNTREVLEWYQRAVVRSLGHLADMWPPEACLVDPVLMASLVRDDEQSVSSDGPLSAVRAIEYRRLVEGYVVQPAFDKAYRSMRESATEYVKSDDGEGDEGGWVQRDLDPSRQDNVAMRPGFQVLDDRQHRALTRLWGGFDDIAKLSDWLHSLSAPAYGEVPDGLAQSVLKDQVALDYLVRERDTVAARKYREAFAATRIIPSFVDGVRAAEAAELAKTASDGPMTLRQEGTK